MEYNKLGGTEMEVSRISFGGLFVSRVGGEYEQARAALIRGLELGVNYFDTAPSYADSETVIGKAIGDLRPKYYISTKLGGRPIPFDPRNPDHFRASLETSMKLLGTDHIDLLMIHEPDRPGQYDWFEDWDTVTGPVCDFLEECREDGLVDYTGLGGTTVYSMKHLIEKGSFDVVLTAFNSSLLWREAFEHVIPAARRRGMGVISGSPLQQGWLSRRYEREILDRPPWLSPDRGEQLLRLYRLADEVEMPLPEMALRFVISNPDVDTVLMGARSREEVEKNVESVERGPLPRDLLKELDQIHGMVPLRPCEEPMCCALANPDYLGPGQLR